jgi:hypothetical protein
MAGLKIKCETQTVPKRLIYFSGNQQLSTIQDANKIITRVYADYQTINGMYNWATRNWFPLESATRTLSNLYNLHACRGIINDKQQLKLESSMSGPHHYFGHLYPQDYITIHIPQVYKLEKDDNTSDTPEYGLPIYASYSVNDMKAINDINFKALQSTNEQQMPKMKTRIPAENILTLSEYTWISGKDMTTQLKKRYGYKNKNTAKLIAGATGDITSTASAGTGTDNYYKLLDYKPLDYKPLDYKYIDTNTGLESDSLFPNPGVLELSINEISLQIINPDPATNGGKDYDFSQFGAQIVSNSRPWRFNQSGIQSNPHAQHKLRLITYYYGRRYVSEYLMRSPRHPQGVGSGLFIERHEFIQAITPINPDCGGFVILGRELKTWQGRKVGLELIGVRVPFGYTLLVEPWAIHGDSNLTGLYSMAMTGNHIAMQTADTVFIKNHNNAGNVRVIGDTADTQPISDKIPTGPQQLLITSDRVTNEELQYADQELKNEIRTNISWLESWYYNPVMWTPRLGKKILAGLAGTA